jgi:hypothetical protein
LVGDSASVIRDEENQRAGSDGSMPPDVAIQTDTSAGYQKRAATGR